MLLTPATRPSEDSFKLASCATHGNKRVTRQPMAHLFPELLSSIFLSLADSCEDDARTHMSALLLTTHVCAYWREVAISCAALWSDLLFIHPRLTELMLERSQGAPLSIAFHGRDRRYRDILSRSLSQTHRLRHVDLWGMDENGIDFATVLAAWSNARAPLLRTLELQDFPMSNGALPPNFLEGGAPLLKKLKLDGLQMVIPAWNVSHLGAEITHFHLDSKITDIQRPSSPDAFFDFLACMPHLRSFSTFCSLPLPTTHETNPERPPLEFPRLEELKLNDSAAAIALFSRSISIPSTTTIQLKFSYSGHTSHEQLVSNLDEVLSNLCESWKHGSRPRVHDLRIEHNHLGAPTYEFRGHDGVMDVSMRFWNDEFVHQAFLALLDRRWDLSPLTSLKLTGRGAGSIPVDAWTSTLAPLPNLSAVEFEKAATALFTTALLDVQERGRASPETQLEENTLPDPQSPTPPLPAFPALTTIRWVGVTFDETTEDSQESVRRLLTASELRGAQYPGLKLEVTRCINFSAVSIPAQARLRLEWDGDVRKVDVPVDPAELPMPGDEADKVEEEETLKEALVEVY